ncbi:SDR family NAD(P)-dependent oxidoreductase [Streptomyces sp. NPDC090303]|uniref:SDR family NAD(P)-dependent oxidoreductase n=1 Tax=Streptomyces sp. NPDC090303 TaxID=3365960 RepID=UPI00382ED450
MTLTSDPCHVALVAGGTSGLGLATARHLLARGMRVVLLARDADRGHAAVKALGPGAAFTSGDVAAPAAVDEALDIAEALGSLRLAVDCAGVSRPGAVLGRGGPLALEDFTAMISSNLTGAFNLTRLAAARMAAREPVDAERGLIVLTASAAAFDGQRGQAPYAAAKAGVVGMTLPLARDLAAHAIRVVTVAPGLFDTPMLRGLPDRALHGLARELVHPREFGDPERYAALVGHILDNPMINGTTLRLDGAVRLPSGLPHRTPEGHSS